MSVTVSFLTTLGFYWFEQHRRLWHSFIRSLEDLSDLYVGYCGDCDVVNKPRVECQTYFSVCLGASFCCLDNHV